VILARLVVHFFSHTTRSLLRESDDTVRGRFEKRFFSEKQEEK
jgi:hypothetical protein